MAASRAASIDRRVHPRFLGRDLRGLHAARVKYGQDITVLNLSAGGVSFETAGRLTADSTLVLEFLGTANASLVPSRVLRCHTVPTFDHVPRTRGACAFRRLLRLKDIVTGTTATADPHADDIGPWHSILGKYSDGRLVHGYTSDFNPVKSHMHVSPTPSSKEAQPVPLGELDALFFLQEAPGNGGDAKVARESTAPYGRRVAVVLPSGEELFGSTLNYSRSGHGFFIHPSENDFGVARVFVTPGGIRNLRFL